MELVREVDGVRYYDDSASTTPESTINALRSFPEGKVVLLAGGADKRLAFDVLAKEIVRTSTRTLLIGQTRERIAEAIRGAAKRLRHTGVRVECFESLEGAVAAARSMAAAGEAVVLSPGCTSFDMFRNAKHRGERFQEIVRALR
jgi:UDP-N-acetylmuramoylalanine--D-glutamate ligase